MRKAIILGIAAAAIIGAAAFVFAKSENHFGPAFGHGRPGVAMFLRQLNLTDEQKSQVKDILTNSRTAVQPLVDEMKSNREKLMQSDGQPFDEAQVTAIAKRQGELMSQLIVERERTKSQIFALLTDDQKAKANTMREKMQERFKGRSAQIEGSEGPSMGF